MEIRIIFETKNVRKAPKLFKTKTAEYLLEIEGIPRDL